MISETGLFNVVLKLQFGDRNFIIYFSIFLRLRFATWPDAVSCCFHKPGRKHRFLTFLARNVIISAQELPRGSFSSKPPSAKTKKQKQTLIFPTRFLPCGASTHRSDGRGQSNARQPCQSTYENPPSQKMFTTTAPRRMFQRRGSKEPPISQFMHGVRTVFVK